MQRVIFFRPGSVAPASSVLHLLGHPDARNQPSECGHAGAWEQDKDAGLHGYSPRTSQPVSRPWHAAEAELPPRTHSRPMRSSLPLGLCSTAAAAAHATQPALLLPFGVRHASFWPFGKKKAEDSATSSPTEPMILEGSEGGADPQGGLGLGPPSTGGSPLEEADPGAALPVDSLADSVNAIHEACDAIESVSIAEVVSEAWFSSAWFIEAIVAIHENTGLPWWASIAAINIIMRCITFPLMVVSQKTTAKMVMFNQNMQYAKHLQEQLSKAKTQDESNHYYTAFRSEYNKQVAKNGDPVKMAAIIPGVLIVNGFVFISIFNGVSKLMESKAPSLTVGGMLWFEDLTVCDAYYGLPIICCLTTLAMVEFGMSMDGGTELQNQQNSKMKWLMRGFSLMFIPAGGMVSAGTAMLWVSNSAVAVLQGVLMKNDGVRRSLGLPTMVELRNMSTMAQQPAANYTPPADTPSFPPSPVPFDPPPPGQAPPPPGQPPINP
eukprot:gene26423-17522_t